MSTWAKPAAGVRRPSGNSNGSAQQLRLFRRSAPYPSREERTEELKDALDSYEELEQLQGYSTSVTYETYKPQPSVLNPPVKAEVVTPAERRKALYQKFYKQVQEARKPADCVVLSVTNKFLDYPKSLSLSLQERGLSVEMLYLQAESGLTRALQDVRADGSPLCILVEQKNVALTSCTVIIFSESLKIHRNMPKDQALDFVQAEYNRGLLKETSPRDPADIAAQASQLLDDFLDREKIARHTVPSETRHLLSLLAEGVHLYIEELETISEYIASRQEHLQALELDDEDDKGNMIPPGLGKPPPLLPTPPSSVQPQSSSGSHGNLSSSTSVGLLPTPGSFPKTKPPPLLSLHRSPPGMSRPPPSSLDPYGVPGLSRGPLLHHTPPLYSGHRAPPRARVTPSSSKSSRPPLLSTPVGPHSRLSGPRH
ncbi:nuclear receptor coactivator 5 [Cyprinodon tularosa]|uniref:Nuclear receptor coactivator 5-like n=1 Tax=Cyprinodon variegatus TaxID=28743 RepID=A0A3Q2EDH5_CYPVA|nr:PREDICTED: nuclear receptor coactivator 5-like [Cyprinodon variegatus]XP_038149902.1 nuclear receptor coactivator 5 [Cyprinodon tularosa]